MSETSMELIVGGTPPTITSNFEELKLAIQARLAPYRVQVTEENLAECKKLATELGKGAVQLKNIGKEKTAAFSAPIKHLESQVMELVGMIQEGQDFLKKQVKVFEDKRRATCETAMIAALKGAYLTLSVRKEYQKSFPNIPEMVGISKITDKGILTKAANDSIMALATTDRGVQDRVDGRLAVLEAECLKHGLKSPLQKEHVSNFIQLPDIEYSAKIQELIAIEIARQEKTLAAEKERMERETREKAEKEAREKAAKEAKERAEKEREDKEQKEKAEKAKKEEAEKVAKEEALKNTSALTPTQEPPPPQKSLVIVTIRFPIETEKTTQKDFENYYNYFLSKISPLGLPPFNIKIEKSN